MSNKAREFDVVIWGATGFTGALVAEYLLAQYGADQGLRWAIAGRDAAKLESLRTGLGEAAGKLECIVTDSFDDAGLASMAARSKVIISTVGPYARFGSLLVAACVAAGTHYCDLAGEAQWIRKMIDTHHQDAQRTGSRIVHCCGFDSVPMDLGVWFLQSQAQAIHGNYCDSITMLVKATKGGASGGTIASMLNLVKEARADRAIAKILVDPYGMNPEGERSGPDGRDQQNVRFDKTANTWTAPFVMAGINTKVVRRSHALQDFQYGEGFRYREAVMTGNGFGGWLKAQMMTIGLGTFIFLASKDMTSGLLERFVLTKPGDGPDRHARETGFFDLRQFGVLSDGSVVKTRITGDRDPGYGSTSKMLGECAVCLAQDTLASAGGIWTPAAAMGDALLTRLRVNAGLSFEILGA